MLNSSTRTGDQATIAVTAASAAAFRATAAVRYHGGRRPNSSPSKGEARGDRSTTPLAHAGGVGQVRKTTSEVSPNTDATTPTATATARSQAMSCT